MRLNLEALHSEIQDHLASRGMGVFYSHPRSDETPSPVFWDTAAYPDYRLFLAAAEAAGARLMTFCTLEFDGDLIDDAVDRLENSDLPQDERRIAELRLREMLGYAGFTCQIELSFDLGPRVYVFDLRTEWFDELNDLLENMDDSYSGEHEEDEPLGGYYSKN